MATLYDTLVAALRQHWQAHDNQYPTFILSPEQHRELIDTIAIVREPFGESAAEFPKDRFHGAPLQVQEGASLQMRAVDGTVSVLTL